MKALIPPLIQPRSQAIASKKLGASPLTKDQRREVIKKYAVEVSEKHGGGKFTVQEVVDAIKANGIELGVDVPNTTVGNVLIKSGEWKRLEKGVFEDIGI